MATEIVINVTAHETRVALLENGSLAELHIEREFEKSIVGNIYKGRVQRVLPGMQAAFVDIGLDRAAFLYVNDICGTDLDTKALLQVFQNGHDDLDVPQEQESMRPPPAHIEDLLCEGREIMAQVIKEPIGSKGARISTNISLPGRYLVYMPTMNTVGISRRITDEQERCRLREIVERIKTPDSGFIIRTASEGASEDELIADRDFLLRLWNDIQQKMQHAPAASVLHEDLCIALRAMRDLLSRQVRRVVVDSPEMYRRIISFIETFVPQLSCAVELYNGDRNIFERYGIELEISRALGKNVWLKSGGYIVIEETEALVVIDVNTGRYVGKGNQADTILKTNLEAVKEIAYQIRLRNIGGIIIIDFIDMERKADRETVLNALQEELRKDRAKTTIVTMSDLGLVQMTRKRIRENLSGIMCDTCPYCEGRGKIKSAPAVAYDLLRSIRSDPRITGARTVIITVHPAVASFLYEEERLALEEIEHSSGAKLVIKPDSGYHQEKFDITIH
ncbi:MAG: Rne/Rng family ribonuclease [Desulfobacterota bacterium]|nr:Rne/Rng family ribonuclease [Thermodesulfobacteriota bacterium]